MASHENPRGDAGRPSPSNGTTTQFYSGSLPVPNATPASLGVSQNPTTVFQQIHELSAKRISTLDYLRKALEGQIYWYNTLFFTKTDFAKMPFFETRKLAKRAANLFLLGLSLPSVLDTNSSTPMEYLRALNTLLGEFEAYQQMRSPDGATASSLSRARIPQMFKRATQAGGKGRRTSSAADIGPPLGFSEHADQKSTFGGMGFNPPASFSFIAGDQEFMTSEEYTYLLTPALPFDPDFFETFATLCNILIDCYTRILTSIPSPSAVSSGIGETFAKADARVRKIILASVVKDFEDASRGGAKAEFAGFGKVLMGGLV